MPKPSVREERQVAQAEYEGQLLATRSLAGANKDRFVAVYVANAACGAIIATAALVVIWVVSGGSGAPADGLVVAGTMIAAAVSCLVILLAVNSRVQNARAAREVSWLGSTPYAIDSTRYLLELSEKRPSCRLTVSVRFSGPVGAAEAPSLATSARAREPRLEAATWSDDRAVLTLRSRPLTTVRWTQGGGKNISRSTYTNEAVHALLRSVVDDVLPLLRAAPPIEGIGIALGDREG